MPVGKVIFILDRGAFGFIKPQSGNKDIFFHRSHIVQSDANALRAGSVVTFEFGPPHKGRPQAVHVKLVEQQEVKATDDGEQALAWAHRKDEQT